MPLTFPFILNSMLLGVGLAMDAFSVSIANALGNTQLKKRKMLTIAGTFSFFQWIMPLIGWLCVRTLVQYFQTFELLVPYIALGLLAYIGGKTIYDSLKANDEKEQAPSKPLRTSTLLLQGVATSIDALSVGFTIEMYDFAAALSASLIIGAVTFLICMLGLVLGKKCGKYFKKAEIIGGVILIAIGIEIFIKGVFF